MVCCVLLTVSLASCSRSGCGKDADCKGDRICVEQQCVELEPEGTEKPDRPPAKQNAPEAAAPAEQEQAPIAMEGKGEEGELVALFDQLHAQLSEEQDCRESYFESFLWIDALELSDETTAAWADLSDLEAIHERQLSRFEELDSDTCARGSILAITLFSRATDLEWAESRAAFLDLMRTQFGRVPVEPGALDTISVEAKDEALERLRSTKVSKTVELGDVKLTVDKVKTANKWRMDRHGRRWMELEANKNNEIVSIDFTVTSESANPKLPVFAAFVVENGEAKMLGMLSTHFYKWEDYGTYLGNYHDSGNDFRKRNNIRFTAGKQFTKNQLKDLPIMIGVFDTACQVRERVEYGNPEVRYSFMPCIDLLPEDSLLTMADRFTPLVWKNQKKLPEAASVAE